MDEERERGEMDRDRERVKGRGIERERLKGRGIERKRRFSFNYSKNLSNGEIKHKQRPDKKYHQKALFLTQKAFFLTKKPYSRPKRPTPDQKSLFLT